MDYFVIEPEVAGGLGPRTVINRDVHPPVVQELHYVWDGWLGDALVASFPCYIVSESLKANIENLGLTGAKFAPLEMELSEQFRELYPSRSVPDFSWLKVDGKPGKDDFGISNDFRLVVSRRTLSALRKLGLEHARIAEYT